MGWSSTVDGLARPTSSVSTPIENTVITSSTLGGVAPSTARDRPAHVWCVRSLKRPSDPGFRVVSQVHPGQRINITLWDFALESGTELSYLGDTCFRYAVIKVGVGRGRGGWRGAG